MKRGGEEFAQFAGLKGGEYIFTEDKWQRERSAIIRERERRARRIFGRRELSGRENKGML